MLLLLQPCGAECADKLKKLTDVSPNALQNTPALIALHCTQSVIRAFETTTQSLHIATSNIPPLHAYGKLMPELGQKNPGAHS